MCSNGKKKEKIGQPGSRIEVVLLSRNLLPSAQWKESLCLASNRRSERAIVESFSFTPVLLASIEKGRFRFPGKQKDVMLVDHDPFPDTMLVNMFTPKFKLVLDTSSEEPQKASARNRLNKSKEPIHGYPDSPVAATLNSKGVNGACRPLRSLRV